MSSGKVILLIEDNPSDVELTRRALQKSRIANQLVVAEDGEALWNIFGGRVLTNCRPSHCSISTFPSCPGLRCLSGLGPTLGPGGCLS